MRQQVQTILRKKVNKNYGTLFYQGIFFGLKGFKQALQIPSKVTTVAYLRQEKLF